MSPPYSTDQQEPVMADEAKQEAPAIKTTPVKLLYAYWHEEDVRIEAGTIIDLPFEAARKIIAEGKAERADAFPGEQ